MVTTTTSPRRARFVPSLSGDDPEPVAGADHLRAKVTQPENPAQMGRVFVLADLIRSGVLKRVMSAVTASRLDKRAMASSKYQIPPRGVRPTIRSWRHHSGNTVEEICHANGSTLQKVQKALHAKAKA